MKEQWKEDNIYGPPLCDNYIMIPKYRLLSLALLLVLTIAIKPHSSAKTSTPSTTPPETVPAVPVSPPAPEPSQTIPEKTQNTAKTSAGPHRTSSAKKQASHSKTTSKKNNIPPASTPVQSASPASNTASAPFETQEQLTSAGSSPGQGPHSFMSLAITYGVILIVLVVGAKYAYFPKSNILQVMLDVFLLVDGLLKGIRSKKGYEPPSHAEQVDDANTIDVGYNEDHGKQLFWERNSVEGI